MAKVLVADDDKSTRNLLCALLQTKGHASVTAPDGQAALDVFRKDPPDLAIVDLGMPNLDGMKLVARVREELPHLEIPILILTSDTEQASRYEGFLNGADDFVCKPFDPVELLLRVDALLRRSRKPDPTHTLLLSAGPYLLDTAQFVFKSPVRTARLTRAELAIMIILFRKPGQVFSADELLQQALEYPRGVGSPDTVHTHVRNLRHKIEVDPASPRVVRTVVRLGYRLEPDPQAE